MNLKKPFFLKNKKSAGYGEVSSNVIKSCFSELNYPLKYLFRKSIEKGVSSNALKIARVTPLFKGGDPSDISNYRPILVLPCFLKILECLYKYLTTEKLLYSKQFGFQTGLSTEHAIVKLVDQIYKSFEKDHYTQGVFIDLSKAFDTVDHTILIRKLEMYGIRGINLAWFRSYLINRIQYISITHDLDPVMFADDTNLFYEHKDLKTLFSLINQELQKIN